MLHNHLYRNTSIIRRTSGRSLGTSISGSILYRETLWHFFVQSSDSATVTAHALPFVPSTEWQLCNVELNVVGYCYRDITGAVEQFGERQLHTVLYSEQSAVLLSGDMLSTFLGEGGHCNTDWCIPFPAVYCSHFFLGSMVHVWRLYSCNSGPVPQIIMIY